MTIRRCGRYRAVYDQAGERVCGTVPQRPQRLHLRLDVALTLQRAGSSRRRCGRGREGTGEGAGPVPPRSLSCLLQADHHGAHHPVAQVDAQQVVARGRFLCAPAEAWPG